MLNSTLRTLAVGCSGLAILATCCHPASAQPAPAVGSPPMASHAQPLTTDLAHEVSRVIGAPLEQLKEIRKTITEQSARQLDLLKIKNGSDPFAQFLRWHLISLNVTGLDYAGYYVAGKSSTNYDQFGPPRTSRALAMVHIAMFEVANAYASPAQQSGSILMKPTGAPPPGSSEAAAIIEAAYQSLVPLYPHQSAELGLNYQQSLHGLSPDPDHDAAITAGMMFGKGIAMSIIAQREADPTIGYDELWVKDDSTTPVYDPMVARNPDTGALPPPA